MAIVQVEGISVVPFSEAVAANDCQLFHEVVWQVATPNGSSVTRGNRATEEDYKLAILFERISYFYLRTLTMDITEEELEASEWHHKSLMVYAHHCISQVALGKQPGASKEWEKDTRGLIFELMNE
jgi:hybrid polyketide synthase / nonribosomal peptide synthetase ACE1